MIRVYFDSDVINNIRSGNFPELANFIKKNRHKLLIPYSQAHVSDKLPSKNVNEDFFWRDIDFITEFTKSKLLVFDDKKKSTVPCIATARSVLEEVEDTNRMIDEFSSIDNIISYMLETSKELGAPEMGEAFKNIFDGPAFNAIAPESMQAETYKDQLQKAADYMHSLRNDAASYKKNDVLIKNELGLPSHAGQWTEKTIDKIDEHLIDKGQFNDFMTLIESGFTDKENITSYSYYIQSFLMLNMLGFKSDEINIKKNKGMQNHLQDAMHSYYGGHCDYFVVMDKKLEAKTRALYEKFGVYTKVFHPEQVVSELGTRLKQIGLAQVVKETTQKEPVGILEEEGVSKSIYRLDNFWFEYFTHLQQEVDTGTGTYTYIFTKMYTNYSNFMYYEEHDELIITVNSYFGNHENKSAVLAKFKSENTEDHYVEFRLTDLYVKLVTDGSKFYLYIVLPTDKDS